MCAGTGETERQLAMGYLVDQQPVRRDVALAAADIVAGKKENEIVGGEPDEGEMIEKKSRNFER